MKPHIKIGAHPYTKRQILLLEQASIDPKPVAEVKQINNVNEVVVLAKEKRAVIVVQALPLPLLVQLINAAARAGVEVYTFELETVATVGKDEPCPADADIQRVSGEVKRCTKTKALKRLKKIVCTEESEVVAQ